MRIQKNFSVVHLYYFLQSFDSYRIVCLNPCIIVYINTDIVNAFSLYQNEFLHDTPNSKNRQTKHICAAFTCSVSLKNIPRVGVQGVFLLVYRRGELMITCFTYLITRIFRTPSIADSCSSTSIGTSASTSIIVYAYSFRLLFVIREIFIFSFANTAVS